MRNLYLLGVGAVLLVTVFAFAVVTTASGADFPKGPYLQQMGTTGVTVMWETDKPEPATIEYGTTGALGKSVVTRGRTQPAAVRIDGLEPGTTYYYRVTEGEASSRVYTFTTLPDKGAFTFVAYGDTRTNPGDHSRVCAGIAGKTPAFILHVGDLVWDGREKEAWPKDFFDPAAPVIARFNMFTVPGNHEEESPLYYTYFRSRDGKPWYSFDCVNAHFVMLNSCLPLGPDSEQYKWLVSDLASTDKRWRFVTFHTPMYSSGAHGNNVELRETLMPLFMRYKVDMVFVGHDHDYERTYPIVSAFASAHPLIEVVTGGGGAPRRPVKGAYFTAKSLSDLSYCTIAIDGDTLAFKAYNADDRVFDEVAITKSGDGYAAGFPGKSVALELGEAEASVQKALTKPAFDYPAADRKETVDFELAAPQWSALDLDIEWVPAHDDVVMSPAKQHLTLEAGKTATLKYELAVARGVTAAPMLRAKGKTSLGEFAFETKTLRFKPKPETETPKVESTAQASASATR